MKKKFHAFFALIAYKMRVTPKKTFVTYREFAYLCIVFRKDEGNVT